MDEAWDAGHGAHGVRHGGVPLDSGSPFGIRRLRAILESGGNVMLFPTGSMDPAAPSRPGVEWLAGKTGARIVEVEITGASESLLFSRGGRKLIPDIQIVF